MTTIDDPADRRDGDASAAAHERAPHAALAHELLPLLDEAASVAFGRLARLATAMTGAPVALAVLVDDDRQVFIGQDGLAEPWSSRGETPLSHSFCQFVAASGAPLVVEDARLDDRLRTNLAIRDLGVVAYAGFPITADGASVGSFCLIDGERRQWSEAELAAVSDLAAVATDELALRIALANQRTSLDALEDSDRRYQSLIAALSDGVVLQASDGAILECNHAAEEILGLSADQMMGRTSLDPSWRAVRDNGQDFPGIDHPAMVTLRTGESCRDVIMGVHKPSGALTWISVSTEPLIDGNSPLPYAVACSFKDITDARKASLALQRSERVARSTAETLSAVLDAARHDAIVATDALGVVEVFNSGAERILGTNAAAILGRSMADVLETERLRVPGPDGTWLTGVEGLRRAAAVDVPQTIEAQYMRLEGDVVELALTISAITGLNGNVAGYVGVAHDVTQSRALSRALAVEGDRLLQANTELADYAHLVSHDLSEPLRAISGFAELLAEHNEGKLDPESDGYIERITGGVRRMKLLIDALLEYAQAGNRDIRQEAVDFDALVHDAKSALAVLVHERNATIATVELPTVIGDATLLRQLVQNLLANAVKFGDAAAPEVHISAQRGAGQWEFFVRDNGIGIEERHRTRIFKPFQQLSRRTEHAGSGIGLAICRRIVERHGGSISVIDRADGGPGSVFRFTLPDR